MLSKNKFIIRILLISLLIIFFINASYALVNPSSGNIQQQSDHIDNNSVNTNETEGTNNIETETLLQSYKSFDHTLSILNIVVTLIGVLVGLITVILALFALFGISVTQIMKDYRSSMETLLRNTEKQSNQKLKEVDQQLEKAKNLCIDTEKQVKDLVKELNEYGWNEVGSLRNEIMSNFFSDKIPSDEINDKLKKLEVLTEFKETYGVPLKTTDLLNRGVKFYSDQNYQDAINEFKKILINEPSNSEALTYIGLSLSEINDFQEALKYLNLALESKKDNEAAIFNKGYVLTEIGKYDDALKEYDKLLKLNPNEYVASINKAYIFAKLGDFHEALNTLNKELIKKPNSSLIHYIYACVYSLMKDKKNAIKYLKRAVERNPNLKEKASNDEDFKDFKELWNDIEFKEIIE